MAICEYCGAEFEPEALRGRTRKYCSRECCCEAYKKKQRMTYVGKREKVCRFCGKDLPKNKTRFCCKDHSQKYNRIQHGLCQSYDLQERACAWCGKTFSTYRMKKTTCSLECQKKLHNYRTDHRLTGITVDADITIEKLARRDNQICQLCGMPVDWNDYKIVNDQMICGNSYPSVDHIVPISQGGLHEWGNIQLAHRVCNSRKGAREEAWNITESPI